MGRTLREEKVFSGAFSGAWVVVPSWMALHLESREKTPTFHETVRIMDQTFDPTCHFRRYFGPDMEEDSDRIQMKHLAIFSGQIRAHNDCSPIGICPNFHSKSTL
jgi:hypothetical protein